jgi:hypothetical protein
MPEVLPELLAADVVALEVFDATAVPTLAAITPSEMPAAKSHRLDAFDNLNPLDANAYAIAEGLDH